MREVRRHSSLSKNRWHSYLFVLIISVVGIQWLNSSSTYFFQASFDVNNSIANSPQLTELSSSRLDPFRLQKTYLHISLQRVAARLTLHDLSSDNPFRTLNENYANYERDIVKVEISRFLDGKPNSTLSGNPFIYQMMDDLGYGAKELEEKLSIKWNEDASRMTVSFSSESPFLSAFVVNDLNRELSRVDKQLRQTFAEVCLKTFHLTNKEMTKRWEKDLDTNDLTHEVEGKKYWMSAHFPRSRFWLKDASLIDQEILAKIKKVEIHQEALMRDRLEILDRGAEWTRNLKEKQLHYSDAEYRALEVVINIQERRVVGINKKIAEADQTLQHFYDHLPDHIKNEDWILINEDASTIYITKNYFQELHRTNRVIHEVNTNPARFTINPHENNLRKTPDFMVYFWLMLLGTFGFFGLDVIFDKFGSYGKKQGS